MERRRPRSQFFTVGPSRAKQAFKDECDVNGIMRRFEQTGIIEHVNRYPGGYGDYTNAPQDYQEAVNQVMQAQEMFASLPAKVRRRFNNDPGAFLEAVDDPARQHELVELGLATLKPSPADSEIAGERIATGEAADARASGLEQPSAPAPRAPRPDAT